MTRAPRASGAAEVCGREASATPPAHNADGRGIARKLRGPSEAAWGARALTLSRIWAMARLVMAPARALLAHALAQLTQTSEVHGHMDRQAQAACLHRCS